MQLFKRNARVTIGALEIVDLAIHFQITKDLKPEPNHAKVTVWNLSPEHRRQLSEPTTLPCKVEAGYGSDLHVLFQGEVRTANHVVDGPQVVTTVETGDGDAQIGGSRVGLQIPPKATPQQIIELVGEAMGIGLGTLPQAIAGLQGDTGAGTVVHGRASEALTHFTRAHGYEWSVQDGALQVMQRGQPISDRIVLLSAESGLVGSPTVDNKGVLTAKALIQPELMPGRLVSIDSVSIKGAYRIESVTFSGETRGNSWYAEFHARKH